LVTDAGAKDTAQIIKKGELAFAFFVLALRLGLANHVLQPFSLWARCTEIARLCESTTPYEGIANDIELNHGFNTRGNCGGESAHGARAALCCGWKSRANLVKRRTQKT
jgi:hypothetical protein